VLGCLLLVLAVALPRTAAAVPSFARQTGLPCAQCHVIAFGPALTEYGRQFKLNGYTFKKQDSFNIPIALAAQLGYENVSKPVPAPSPYSDKENLYLQDVDAYVAGGFGDHFGSFAKITYNAIAQHFSWDKLDVRFAHPLELGGHSLVAGIDVNNQPMVQDLWSSMPVWGFPYNETTFSPFPQGGPVLFGTLGQTVLGATAYSMIDNLVYAEVGFYKGVSNKWLGNLGLAGANPNIVGAAPYVRATVQKQAGPHYLEVGFTGMWVKQEPYTPTSSATNRYSDYALDVSYQFNVGAPHAVDAHASFIHEDRNLDASFAAGASDATSNSVNTLEADASYILEQTWVASLGLFSIDGTTNHLLFQPGPVFGNVSGTPQTSGYRAQLEWVPFGKAGSALSPWVNLRLALQYTGYWRFNGSSSNYDGFGRNASDNDTLFVFAWLAF
jgi:hypothetical protein